MKPFQSIVPEQEMISSLLIELSEHIDAFGDRLHEFGKAQAVIQRALNNLDRFMLSMSASHSILPVSKDSNSVSYIYCFKRIAKD